MSTRATLRARCYAVALVGLLFAARIDAAPRATFGDPDTEAARRHYARGRTLYDAARFDEACGEFEIARRILNLPALDYNLAICEERLEHWARSVELYERYLAAVSDSTVAAEIRERIAQLSERIVSLQAVAKPLAPPPPSMTPTRIAAISLAAGTLALGAAGTGAYFSAWRSYDEERRSCRAHPCTRADTAPVRDKVDRAERAGYALWGITGAVAVADIVLWVVDARRQRGERAAATFRIFAQRGPQ